MNIETQIAFIRIEKQKHLDAAETLQAIEDTLTEKIAPVIASLEPLISAKANLEVEVATEKGRADTAEARIAVLETEKGVLLTENETLKVEPLTREGIK